MIFDIDAYKQQEFATDDPTSEQTFGQLRRFKNLVFFNSLTEDMSRRFE